MSRLLSVYTGHFSALELFFSALEPFFLPWNLFSSLEPFFSALEPFFGTFFPALDPSAPAEDVALSCPGRLQIDVPALTLSLLMCLPETFGCFLRPSVSDSPISCEGFALQMLRKHLPFPYSSGFRIDGLGCRRCCWVFRLCLTGGKRL